MSSTSVCDLERNKIVLIFKEFTFQWRELINMHTRGVISALFPSQTK